MTGRSKVDWEAVERDYRTTKLTLRELADKYGIGGHTAIANRIKRHGWKRDLTDAVKLATKAKLVEQAVTELVTKAGSDVTRTVTDTVLAAAEVNTQLILRHKKRLADLQGLVLLAQQKVEEVSATVGDVREVATLVQAVGNLAGATKTLNEQERKAFGLDDEAQEDDQSTESLLKRLGQEIRGGA